MSRRKLIYLCLAVVLVGLCIKPVVLFMKFGQALSEEARRGAEGAKKQMRSFDFRGRIVARSVHEKESGPFKYRIAFRVESWYAPAPYGLRCFTSCFDFQKDSMAGLWVPLSVYNISHAGDMVSHRSGSDSIFINGRSLPLLSNVYGKVIAEE